MLNRDLLSTNSQSDFDDIEDIPKKTGIMNQDEIYQLNRVCRQLQQSQNNQQYKSDLLYVTIKSFDKELQKNLQKILGYMKNLFAQAFKSFPQQFLIDYQNILDSYKILQQNEKGKYYEWLITFSVPQIQIFLKEDYHIGKEIYIFFRDNQYAYIPGLQKLPNKRWFQQEQQQQQQQSQQQQNTKSLDEFPVLGSEKNVDESTMKMEIPIKIFQSLIDQIKEKKKQIVERKKQLLEIQKIIEEQELEISNCKQKIQELFQ